jgi:hypothetical protein
MLASHSCDLPGFHSSMTILLDGSWTVILLDKHDSKSLPDLAAEILSAALQNLAAASQPSTAADFGRMPNLASAAAVFSMGRPTTFE